MVLFIGLIVLSIIALFCCTYMITRVLVPIISRMRSNMMVEEKPDPKDGSEIIPPSSERNRVSDRRVGDDLIVSASGK